MLEREQMSGPEQVKADDTRISSQVKEMKAEIITPGQAPLCSSSASRVGGGGGAWTDMDRLSAEHLIGI